MERHFRCVDEFTRRCMTPEQRGAFYSLYTIPTMDMQELCTEGSPYREGQYLYIILFFIKCCCYVTFQQYLHSTHRILETRRLLAHCAHRVRAVWTSTPDRIGLPNGISGTAYRKRWNFGFDRFANRGR